LADADQNTVNIFCSYIVLTLGARMSLCRSFRPLSLHQTYVHLFPWRGSIRSFSSSVVQQREVGHHTPAGGSGTPLNFFGRPRLPTNMGIMFVPQQEAWVCSFCPISDDDVQVVERMGKYLATLEPGLRILIPVLDKVKYVQSLKG
jgi:hypothetical protein